MSSIDAGEQEQTGTGNEKELLMGKGMRAGKRPRQKNTGMQQQLQQVQAMQALMEKKQEEIELLFYM